MYANFWEWNYTLVESFRFWVPHSIFISLADCTQMSAEDHRVIGTKGNDLMCIPVTKLAGGYDLCAVGSKVLFSDNEGTRFNRGHLLFIGGIYYFFYRFLLDWVLKFVSCCSISTDKSSCISEIDRIYSGMNDEFRLGAWLLQFALSQKRSQTNSRAGRLVEMAKDAPVKSRLQHIPSVPSLLGKLVICNTFCYLWFGMCAYLLLNVDYVTFSVSPTVAKTLAAPLKAVPPKRIVATVAPTLAPSAVEPPPPVVVACSPPCDSPGEYLWAL